MGTLIEFRPRRTADEGEAAERTGAATVIILPVVRIERHSDGQANGTGPDRGRRRSS
jgi:hypothetical protein